MNRAHGAGIASGGHNKRCGGVVTAEKSQAAPVGARPQQEPLGTELLISSRPLTKSPNRTPDLKSAVRQKVLPATRAAPAGPLTEGQQWQDGLQPLCYGPTAGLCALPCPGSGWRRNRIGAVSGHTLASWRPSSCRPRCLARRSPSTATVRASTSGPGRPFRPQPVAVIGGTTFRRTEVAPVARQIAPATLSHTDAPALTPSVRVAAQSARGAHGFLRFRTSSFCCAASDKTAAAARPSWKILSPSHPRAKLRNGHSSVVSRSAGKSNSGKRAVRLLGAANWRRLPAVIWRFRRAVIASAISSTDLGELRNVMASSARTKLSAWE